MTVSVNWMRNGIFTGTNGQHTVLMDIHEDSDKTPAIAPSPLDLLIMGGGGCTAYDVVHILRGAGQQIDDCQVTLIAKLEDETPETLRTLHLDYHLSGRNLDMKTAEDAIRQSQEKYSIVLITLGKVASITHGLKITEG